MGAPVTTIVRAGVVASGETPFVAVTVKVNVPGEVGVPASVPSVAVRLSPGGRAPEASAKLGAGSPSAVNWYVYGEPVVADSGGLSAVNVGAVPPVPTVIVRLPVAASGLAPLL